MKKLALKSSKENVPSSPAKLLGSGKKENDEPKAKRGFAAQSPEKLKEIASKGGKKSRGGGRTPKSGATGSDKQTTTSPENGKKSKRGFAAMDESKRKSIASMGGKISKGGGRPATASKKANPKKGS